MSFFGYNKIQDQIQDGGRPPAWKISNSIISATVHLIHFVFGFRTGFSGSVNRMVLLPVKTNLRWQPAAILSKNSKWHNSGAAEETVIIKQEIFILKNCRFKYTCNDDNGIGRRKQQKLAYHREKLAYHIVTCKFPIILLQCHDVLTL